MNKVWVHLHLTKTSSLRKRFIIFYVLIFAFLVFAIIGAVLLGLGHPQYMDFVYAWQDASAKELTAPENIPEIAMFIYGIFTFVMGIILFVAMGLYLYDLCKRLQQIKKTAAVA